MNEMRKFASIPEALRAGAWLMVVVRTISSRCFSAACNESVGAVRVTDIQPSVTSLCRQTPNLLLWARKSAWRG